jgi:hypothetical protein
MNEERLGIETCLKLATAEEYLKRAIKARMSSTADEVKNDGSGRELCR